MVKHFSKNSFSGEQQFYIMIFPHLSTGHSATNQQV